MRMVTYSLLPLRLTTKEFGVIRVCLNCKTINKQAIVFSWAKERKVSLVGKLLPMWKGRTEPRTKSAETNLFLPRGQHLWHDLMCCTSQSHQSPQQAGYKLLSNRSCLYLLVVSALEELVAWYWGFFFPKTFKSLNFVLDTWSSILNWVQITKTPRWKVAEAQYWSLSQHLQISELK